MKEDIIFIEHIIDSISAIDDFLRGITEEEFLSDRMRQSAVVREIEVIGEAVKNVSEGIKSKHKDIQWREIAGTRDKMIHHYFGVDLDIVWDIAKINLPDLKKRVLKIKSELD